MHHYRLHHDPLSSHQQIATYVRELKRGPILDVGSAQGMFGQLMQGSGIEIDAVEPHPVWAESAKPFYRQMFQATIEDAPLPDSRYNVIVCADVLEHTVNPVAVLNRLRACATPDATFIISLPNVAHVAVRTMLLFGYFPKMERGVLDKTHLHFFTRETAIDMLRRAGLTVKKRMATVAPLHEIWPRGEGSLPFRMLWHMQHTALKIAPGMFAYQWLLAATPDGKPQGAGAS